MNSWSLFQWWMDLRCVVLNTSKIHTHIMYLQSKLVCLGMAIYLKMICCVPTPVHWQPGLMSSSSLTLQSQSRTNVSCWSLRGQVWVINRKFKWSQHETRSELPTLQHQLLFWTAITLRLWKKDRLKRVNLLSLTRRIPVVLTWVQVSVTWRF